MKNKNLQASLEKSYFDLYKDFGATSADFNALLSVITKRSAERSEALCLLDKRDQDWYMSEKMIGMMLYVDLFSTDLSSLTEKIPYLKDLGITYVHLMPLLKARVGENDGGYAVEDYLDVDPKLGTLKDFVHVVDAFRKNGIDICIDFVLNHTADSHEWAKKAIKGDKIYQDMYIMYDSRAIPDAFDKTVPEVLPDKSPGNFTYHTALKKWIFTSFSDFQWDLNFKNPLVFEKIVDTLLQLANYGVNIIRLDAIAFMWKDLGTDCRNLKPVHDLLHMIHLIKEMVCPSLALLGEAIVQPDEIIKYFGHDQKMECGLLYNASEMVNIFNSFATRDTRLMAIETTKLKTPERGCFMNYIRCHDDIGWGLNYKVLSALNMDEHGHKLFLNDFYSGRFKGSFSMGEIYQFNPVNQDARINGTLASLLGLEKALLNSDTPAIEFAIKRILLAHGMIMSTHGVPLIYSGDEIASLNDQSYLNEASKRNDGRWVHRLNFDWQRSLKRHDVGSIESTVFNRIKSLIDIRKSNPLFNAKYQTKVIELGNNHVYATVKTDEQDHVIFFYNFSENNQYIKADYLNHHLYEGEYMDLISGKKIDFNAEEIHLYPYEFLWLKKA